ncbi:MAG: TetR family transcriptional regulator [Propionibacteriales bacterium]|nr:TetR family transcriptional regulator [Propionibacteriales bacterium]
MTSGTSRGRRPGAPDTRGHILAAARERFANAGYDRTTIRGVAAEAEVDPALVYHYFGAKEDLFLEAMELPVDPRELGPELFGGGMENAGERLARTFLGIWEDPNSRAPMLALLRGGLTTEAGQSLIHKGLVGMLLTAAQEFLGNDDGLLRAELAMSQMIGVAFGRYVIGVEPLASADPEDLVAWLAPTLQRYLTGDPDDLPRV